MAFWLAPDRNGQDTDFIQRFDPRFWTVDFPRPMMASLTTYSPAGMRVDCEFHTKGDLAGLIWESEDRFDHPLLAYATDRDYAHTTLSFRWRSSGVLALDEVNGPTLTIEGRDADGVERIWYVRLWNYAVGTAQDAVITFNFSQLEAGWALPGEAVHPSAIDRLFISLVPTHFEPGSTEPLSGLKRGAVKITDLKCDGARAMLEVGDVVAPEHGERVATAYDDSYNLTPERLVRQIVGLGYREELVHYVGMSHFFRLDRQDDGRLEVARPAVLSRPTVYWHRAFFVLCRNSAISPIVSLSYELFAEHCPQDWQQRAYNGDPARTGWVPPSALLSPANLEAMEWLHQVAALFVSDMKRSKVPVRFQIGEPWWWVMPDDGRPCLYDDAAQALLSAAPEIPTMRGPMDQAQTNLLDEAGALLSASTAALAQAVRDAAGEPAEILLLAFTPTILAEDMPELERANLPLGWAYPAFDRLQLEDYDWLTAGADALRRAAYTHVDQRLGYPLDRQDYLSGFVLLPEDAERMWPLIDAGLDEAAQRGVTRRFIWALPQISRDGYVRLPSIEDDTMQAFDDVLYPLPLGKGTAVSPEFSTSIATTASGHERRNTLWSNARLHFDVGPGIRSNAELGTLLAFFRARRGAARGFRLRDPFDHSSAGMTGTPQPTDQIIGTGDGLAAQFQLAKSYGDGGDPQLRSITRPLANTIAVAVDGQPQANWTLRDGGLIELDHAPADGATITAGFLFDVPVRFASDRIDITAFDFAADEAPSIPLTEIREAV